MKAFAASDSDLIDILRSPETQMCSHSYLLQSLRYKNMKRTKIICNCCHAQRCFGNEQCRGKIHAMPTGMKRAKFRKNILKKGFCVFLLYCSELKYYL